MRSEMTWRTKSSSTYCSQTQLAQYSPQHSSGFGRSGGPLVAPLNDDGGKGDLTVVLEAGAVLMAGPGVSAALVVLTAAAVVYERGVGPKGEHKGELDPPPRERLDKEVDRTRRERGTARATCAAAIALMYDIYVHVPEHAMWV